MPDYQLRVSFWWRVAAANTIPLIVGITAKARNNCMMSAPFFECDVLSMSPCEIICAGLSSAKMDMFTFYFSGGTLAFIMKKSGEIRQKITRKQRRMLPEEFPAWLRKIIGDRPIAEFAAERGLTRETVSGILNGRRQPSQESQGRLGIVRVEHIYVVEE